jgi:hypothetical protein
LVVSLLSGTGGFAAEEPACTRVLPGPTFPRPIVQLPAAPPQSEPDPLEPAESPAGEVDDRGFFTLQLEALDLDGDGFKGEQIEVKGFWVGFFFLTPIPRELWRVPVPGSPDPIWIQELPPGLAGRVRVEDMDGDGKDDLRFRVITLGFFYSVRQEGFQLLWGNGDGPLTVGQRSRSSPRFDRLEDVDGDGLRDLIVTGGTYYPGTSSREFDEGIIYTPLAEDMFIDQPAVWLDIGDVDEDGLDDAVAITVWDETDTLAISNGDGTFDPRPLPKPNPRYYPIVLADLDADGLLDLWARTLSWETPAGFYVAWGRGDATFEPYRFFELPEWPWVPELADLDGDGKVDLFLPRVGSVFFEGREVELVAPSTIRPLAIADVDGDDREDLITATTDFRSLLWHRSLGDGTFAAPLPALDESFDEPIRSVQPRDFDLDGRDDLYVELAFVTARRRFHVLRGDGGGRFVSVWEGHPLNTLGRVDLLADVDADGRPDLVSYEDLPDFDTAIVHETRIRRGNGLGFDPPMEPAWLSFAGRTGRFRDNGVTDMLRVGSFGNSSDEGYRVVDGIFQLELNPSLGHVLERDLAPPIVEARLVRLGEETGDTWRVATLPLDDCSSTPRVLDRRIALLDLPFGSVIGYRQAGTEEIVVYEDPVGGRRGVALLGPDRRRIRARFDEALRGGGVPFEHMEPMELRVLDDFGPPAPGLPGAREVQRFVFDGERLVGASVSRPGGDITFVMLAEDGLQSGSSSASFTEILPGVPIDSGRDTD